MKIKKILAANRSEIAIRIFRAAEECGIKTAAIYSKEDRFALHRFKTDESYLVGKNKGPIQSYLDINSIIKIAKEANVDAIHPGYGFLSESPEFAQACLNNEIEFIGPSVDILRKLGDKVEAKKIAEDAGAKTITSINIPLKFDINSLKSSIKKIGFPLIVKATWGGGGRGMRIIKDESSLIDQISIAKNESTELKALLARLDKDRAWLLEQIDRGKWPELRLDLASLERELGQLLTKVADQIEEKA